MTDKLERKFCMVCNSLLSKNKSKYFCSPCRFLNLKSQKNKEALNKSDFSKTEIIKQHMPRIKKLFYISHIEHLPSLLKHGILSRNKITEENISEKQISNNEIVLKRSKIKIRDHFLPYFVNTYFQPRNAMLVEVLSKQGKNKIIILEIEYDINNPDVIVFDGNAAKNASKWYGSDYHEFVLSQINPILDKTYWDNDNEKRIMQAECLIPEQILPTFFKAIHIYDNHETENQVKSMLGEINIPIFREKTMFFGGIYG